MSSIFGKVDPLLDKNIHENPYFYCSGNPIMYIDPTGMYVNVVDNGDCTYTTYSGELDDDLNVYVVDKDGNRTGQIIGQTLTPYTFFDNNDNFVKGATIDMSDNSGQEFLDGFISNPPSVISYMSHNPQQSGRLFGKYDFKNHGITKDDVKSGKISTEEQTLYNYRAMPINIGGLSHIGTGRDIGNYVAGYLSGTSGIPYSTMRVAFDIYQHGIEPNVSRSAQNIGFWHGRFNYLMQIVPYVK